jgi:hypothetical protein
MEDPVGTSVKRVLSLAAPCVATIIVLGLPGMAYVLTD